MQNSENLQAFSVKKCFEILKQIRAVSLATVDKRGKPQVRIVDIDYVDGEKFYFCTARGKDFYEELEADKNIAITAMNDKFQMIRLNATCQKMQNKAPFLDEIYKQNPSMNEVYPGITREILEVFCVENGCVELFDLSKVPLFRQSFAFGKYPLWQKGFVINENCIECGICKDDCPQECINEGEPYEILEENCLHCGICYEVCPSEAIIRRTYV